MNPQLSACFFLWTGAPIQPQPLPPPKKSWRGESVKLRHTLACRALGGGLENDLESNKKSWRGEAVKLRNTLACRVLGGGRFRK